MWEDRIAARLAALSVRVAIVMPDGHRMGAADAQVVLQLHQPHLAALLAAGQIGAVGEAIVTGRASLQGSMRDTMATVTGLLQDAPTQQHSTFWSRSWRLMLSVMRHTRHHDARQIRFHYDVGDGFYALWLDPLRVYSCAYFDTPEDTLAQAQQHKLDLICRKLMLQPGERFLDIGAGWGALLLWAAEHYGVEATGITLSRNQHAYVNKLIERKGLGERVRMELCDYRDLRPGQPFDKIASVGMFEHVGRANMPRYFEQLHTLLRPGGLLLNHGITAGGVRNSQVGAGMGDFIGRFIFPGGELLHVSHAIASLSDTGLELLDAENLRPHYARTLWAWSDGLEARLEQAQAELQRDGRDANSAAMILRAWRLYLAGCAVAFERRWVTLYQLLASRPDGRMDSGTLRGAQAPYPFRRNYIYAASRVQAV